jgi:hypothetical protein
MTDQPPKAGPSGSPDSGFEEQYRVGYKHPPLHSRFKPGESGNPRGRPRGARNFRTILLGIAMRKVTLVRNKKQLRLTNLEHVIDAVRLRAAQGDPIAMQLVMRYAMPQPDEEEFKIPKGVLIVGEKLTQEEWEAKYGYLGEPDVPEQPCQKAQEAASGSEDKD